MPTDHRDMVFNENIQGSLVKFMIVSLSSAEQHEIINFTNLLVEHNRCCNGLLQREAFECLNQKVCSISTEVEE